MISANGKSRSTDAVTSAVDRALKDFAVDFPDYQGYLGFHRRRYQLLMALVVKVVGPGSAGEDGAPRILDVGPRFEVDLMHRLLPDFCVDTVGLNAGLFPGRGDERRVEFDLEEVDLPERRPTLASYELIVMAEVIEHVRMPPSEIFGWARTTLRPGGFLVVQTPNAVTLPHRLRMLAGRNPYAQPTTNRASPGHVREYTVAELAKAARAQGLEVVQLTTANYFSNGRFINRLFQRLEPVVPRSLRAGISAVFRAPTTDTNPTHFG